MNRIMAIAVCLSWLTMVAPLFAAPPHHVYYPRTLLSVSGSQLVTDNGSFNLLAETVVTIRYKDSKGAYYERKGQLSDMRSGDSVYLKAIGSRVSEIVIMR